MANLHTYGDNVKVVNSVCLALANSTQTGTAVDCLGFRRAAIVFTTNTGSATTSNFIVKDSADNSTFSAAIAGATLGSAVAASTAEFTQVVNVDLAKRQRYLRVDLVGTGTAGFAVANVHLLEPILAAPTQENTEISI